MASGQQQAFEEACATAPVDKPARVVVELDTPAFDAPLYFMAGIEDDVQIKLETGQVVTAIACAFDYTPPGAERGGPTPAKLAIDNVSGRILPYLKQATSAIRVTYRAYLGDDLSTVVDMIEGLELKRVTLSGASAEGELTFAEIATQAFPRRTYDLDLYPGLWNS
jgi:hypothetical protein